MQVLTAGSHLGRFKLIRLIGKGGMGEVWLAQDSRLNRDVAIKVLPPALANQDLRIRFERESKLLAALNHPNIAQIYEAGEEVPQNPEGTSSESSISFLVMEFIEGRSLSEILREGPLPVSSTLRLGRQIAKALAAAHKAGIIHRDLKPANIMVTPKNQVKVLDFGLARPTPDSIISASPAMQEVTVSGVVMGTASYLSPEQIKGDLLDVRSDLWALGCVLYQMISGRTPFPGNSIPEILATVLRDEPGVIDSSVTEIPSELSRLIEKCLRKDPADRPQSAMEVAATLKEIAQPARKETAGVSTFEQISLSRLAPNSASVATVNRYLKAVQPTNPQIPTEKGGSKFVEVTHGAVKIGIMVVPKPQTQEDLVLYIASVFKLPADVNPSLYKKLLSLSNGHSDEVRFAIDENTRQVNLICIQPCAFLKQQDVQNTLDMIRDTAGKVAQNLKSEYQIP
jgi:serine/threonine protein kinase